MECNTEKTNTGPLGVAKAVCRLQTVRDETQRGLGTKTYG